MSDRAAADDLWRAGVAAFRAGRFFEAHERWEDLWRTLCDDDKTFVQGLIHVAVALYQWGRGNARGARSQASRAERKLSSGQRSRYAADVDTRRILPALARLVAGEGIDETLENVVRSGVSTD